LLVPVLWKSFVVPLGTFGEKGIAIYSRGYPLGD
jgi:hypothetical protein